MVAAEAAGAPLPSTAARDWHNLQEKVTRMSTGLRKCMKRSRKRGKSLRRRALTKIVRNEQQERQKRSDRKSEQRRLENAGKCKNNAGT